jgi:hypothetical protein
MNSDRFGQFLVTRGLLSEADLAEAQEIQHTRQSLLGQIAIREQYMTVRQVMDVLRTQAGTAFQFGEVAVQLGYLDEPDVEELLRLQVGTRPRLADVLIERGKLSAETYLQMLNEFHARMPDSNDPGLCRDITGTNN